MKIKCETEVSDETLESLIVGALEGGSNYWYQIEKRIGPKVGKYAVDQVMKGGGFVISDEREMGPEEKKIGRLTLVSCRKALTLMALHHPRHFSNIITENDDAETADVFLQLAVLGEVIYG